jgi:Tfp pilus assembly protein PilN
MEEVAAMLPEASAVSLSLPVGAVSLERMSLPSKAQDELEGMVMLQLEKTLPYAVDELTVGYDIITQEENESHLLAVAVSNEQLDTLCQPLRERRHLPDQIGLYAMQLAARFPAEEVLGLIYQEGDATILAIAERGKLVAAYPCQGAGREEFVIELPRLLLAAELEGVPINFSKVILDRELGAWIDLLRGELLDAPVERATLEAPVPPCAVNLVPSGWTEEKKQFAQTAKIKEWLLIAGAVYLFLLLIAAGYIIWLQRQVNAVNTQVAEATPYVDTIASRKARWQALAPAIDPTRYVVEILNQISHTVPSDDLHVTLLNQDNPDGFEVEGEAPTLDMANNYVDALRNDPNLKMFHFHSDLPTIMANLHAQFHIYATL